MMRLALGAVTARLRLALGRPVRFAGAYPTREAALAALPPAMRDGYDAAEVVDVNLAAMAQAAPWDAPVIEALREVAVPGCQVLDVGGHLGTKYTAFTPHLPLQELRWCVYDLPAVVAAARAAQLRGALPAEIGFTDTLPPPFAPDVVLASGVLQYLDMPFATLLARIGGAPRRIILNKVAVRQGTEVVTLEQIGPRRVPYRIRDRAAFEAELPKTGYRIARAWDVAQIGHRIATHPWHGKSGSMGYVLERPAKS